MLLLLVIWVTTTSVYFSAVNIFRSITTFLGNFLILVALNKESSLHPPSKLLYCCLATTDVLVGLVSQPLYATYWISLVRENWSLCRYAGDGIQISSYTLCGVSLLTLTAISVDRLLALLLGIRYRQTVTLKRTCIMTATFWILSVAAGSISISHTRITPESLSTCNGRNLHIKLCIMWSVFADVDCHKRGTTSRSVLGIRYRQIVTLKRTYIITATFWIFFRRCWIILHFTYSNNHLVYYYSYTVMLSDLNRLVHKYILHS